MKEESVCVKIARARCSEDLSVKGVFVGTFLGND